MLGERGAAGFRELFEGFPEAVGILWPIRDGDGSIVDFSFGYGNLSILRTFRLPAATAERYTLLEALPRMRNSRAFLAYVQVCDSGMPWTEEITYDTPFGDGYMLGTFVQRTVRLGDGLMVFLTDVTEQRRMEGDLQRYADVVAHDLREPLSNMAMLISLIERNAGEPPPADALRLLREANERARELVEGVLSYARVGELQLERVDLGRLAAEVAEDLSASVEEAGATLVTGELPEVEGDPRQLRRVLQNLIGNALKFRSEAPAHIELEATLDTREWIVSVTDNGVGVDRDRATEIFGIFSHGDSGAEGLGIGLAVCRRVVEAHGGRIWVEPVEGGGSAFRFTLPR